jgi:hypothetical protein
MSIGRLAFLAMLLSPALVADVSDEVFNVFQSIANGLSEGDAGPFVRALDPAMPGYQKLTDNVRALVAQTGILSAIEVLTEKGDAGHQDVQLDWFLEITGKGDPMSLVRRRELVKCKLEKQKKKWRIVSLEPVSLFEPPKPKQ